MTDENIAVAKFSGTWVCPECGRAIYMEEAVEPWDCLECGTEMEPQGQLNMTSNEKLRELVDELRERAEHMARQNVYEYADGLLESADDLEELIENE